MDTIGNLENRMQHQKIPLLAPVVIGVLLSPAPATADWKDFLRGLSETFGDTGSGSATATLPPSQQEMIDGLKEALKVATRRSVEKLGRENGFLAHPQLRIPMPSSLDRVEQLLRRLHQEELADEFVATLNHAAERAVSQGAEVFGAAIREMTLQDAAGILQGPDDAATRYFREHTEASLARRMRPIVREATSATGVTRTYKRLVDKAAFLTRYMKPEEIDLDGYITEHALEGLFHELAAEEARIRRDPLARTSELLRRVFGR
ncbi:MAG: hypothetical protein Kow006_11680 [Gammaproteobacteria bacterium]